MAQRLSMAQSLRYYPLDLTTKLDAVLQRHTLVDGSADTKNCLLGASFIVVDRSGIVYAGASGRLDLPIDSPKWQLDTPVWAASLTKLITSIAVLQCVERGDIDLEQDVGKAFPDLGAQPILEGFMPVLDGSADEFGDEMSFDRVRTIRTKHLLTHTSGIPYDFLSPEIRQWNNQKGYTATCNDWSRDGFTNPLLFNPGKGFTYGAGVDWAGFLVEKESEYLRLDHYIKEHIFDRVGGMDDATFAPATIPLYYTARMPAVVRRKTDGTLERTTTTRPPYTHEVTSGGAGLYCTAVDYASLLFHVLRGNDYLHQDGTPLLLENDQWLFEPALNEVGVKEMAKQMKKLWGPAYHDMYDLPEEGCNHSLAAMTVEKGYEGRKYPGSIMWGGARNSHWWVDREGGVAAVLITSIEHLGDRVAAQLYSDLEIALYSGLREVNFGESELPPPGS